MEMRWSDLKLSGFQLGLACAFPIRGIESIWYTLVDESINDDSLNSDDDRVFLERLKIYEEEMENARQSLLSACDKYLIVLPKLMGCLVCQVSHMLLSSPRYAHYQRRKKELEDLQLLLDKNKFDPEQAWKHVDEVMKPFSGQYGACFYEECKGVLTKICKREKPQAKKKRIQPLFWRGPLLICNGSKKEQNAQLDEQGSVE